MKRLTTSVLLIFCLIMASSCGGALKEVTDYTGDITGTVMCDDEPLSSVEVEITPGGSTVFTNNYGTFSFNRIEAGNYKLSYSKDGYKSKTKSVVVKAGETANADISLEMDGNKVNADVEVLDFGKQKNELAINLQNKTGKLVSWEVEKDKLPSWLVLSAYEDDIPSKGTNSVTVRVDRSKVEGESAKASINFLISSGQTIAIKVNVEAGTVGEVGVELTALAYDYFICYFKKNENVAYYYAGADVSASLPEEDIIKYGDKYDTDDEPIIFTLSVPGVDYYLYVIPFNEFDQQGVTQKYLIDIPSNPGTDYTLLDEISAEGKYDVKDAIVFVSNGNNVILTQNHGQSFFYAFFDDSVSDRPHENEVIEITNGNVVMKNGLLAFKNPSFKVSGKIDRKEYFADTESYWRSKTLMTADMMNQYRSSYASTGVVPFEFNGILTSASSGKGYSFAVGYGDAKDPKAAISSLDPAMASTYGDSFVKCNGLAIGVSDGTVQLCPYAFKKISTPLESYTGYWNASAYDVNDKEPVSWEGMEIEAFDDEGETWVWAQTWMQTGFNILAFGRYNEKTGWIDMLGGYYNSSYTFHFNSDPDVSYFAYFYPTATDGINFNIIVGGRDSHGIAVLKPNPNKSEEMILTGDYVLDNNGLVANGFVFKYRQTDNQNNYGYLDTYTDVVLKRSTKSGKTSTSSRSIPFIVKKAIEKHYDVKIPYKRTVDSDISIDGDSSKL